MDIQARDDPSLDEKNLTSSYREKCMPLRDICEIGMAELDVEGQEQKRECPGSRPGRGGLVMKPWR